MLHTVLLHQTILGSLSFIVFFPQIPLSSMLTVVAVRVGLLALLYSLFTWLIPAAAQYNPLLALLWHDVILEKTLNTLTRPTQPQVALTKHTNKHTHPHLS